LKEVDQKTKAPQKCILTLPNQYNNDARDIYVTHMHGHGVSTTPPVKNKLCLEYSEKSNSVILFLENLKVIFFSKQSTSTEI
jgi:hypothetical protein